MNEYLGLGNDSDIQAAEAVAHTPILTIGLDQNVLVIHATAEEAWAAMGVACHPWWKKAQPWAVEEVGGGGVERQRRNPYQEQSWPNGPARQTTTRHVLILPSTARPTRARLVNGSCCVGLRATPSSPGTAPRLIWLAHRPTRHDRPMCCLAC